MVSLIPLSDAKDSSAPSRDLFPLSLVLALRHGHLTDLIGREPAPSLPHLIVSQFHPILPSLLPLAFAGERGLVQR